MSIWQGSGAECGICESALLAATAGESLYSGHPEKEELKMLGENIQKARKKKGMTQEELAIRLHVVRQTVSKWEKNLSVPDADMLLRLSEELELPVQTLLGAQIPDEAEVNEIAEQLGRINEQLAQRNRTHRRVIKIVAISACILLALSILVPVLSMAGLAGYGKTMQVSVVQGEDPRYREDELEAGIRTAEKAFRRQMRGWQLTQLSYDEDVSAGICAEKVPQDQGREWMALHARAVKGKEEQAVYSDFWVLLSREADGAWACESILPAEKES